MRNLARTAAVVLGFAALTAFGTAQAITITGSAGPTTSVAGATTFANFDGIANTAIAAVTGGGASIGADPILPNVATNHWLTAGNLNGIETAITIQFSALADYFGLYWGSIDGQNEIRFFNGATQVGSITTGSSLPLAATGPFINFASASTADRFDRVVLSNSLNSICCFEVDNFAGRLAPSAVPEPASLALAAGALALLVATRRNRHQR